MCPQKSTRPDLDCSVNEDGVAPADTHALISSVQLMAAGSSVFERVVYRGCIAEAAGAESMRMTAAGAEVSAGGGSGCRGGKGDDLFRSISFAGGHEERRDSEESRSGLKGQSGEKEEGGHCDVDCPPGGQAHR